MKKFTIFIGKCMLAAVCAIGLACIGMMREWNDGTIAATFLFGGTIVALCLGVFNIEEQESISSKHTTIKNAARTMRKAA